MTTEVKNYQISLFTDSAAIKTPGDRLAIIRFKSTKNKDGSERPANPSFFVSIPSDEISVEPEDLNKPLTQCFHDLQDSIIREKVLEMLENKVVTSTISNLEINATAASLYYDRVASNGRLSKESIAAWFDTDLAEPLASALMKANNKLMEDADALIKAVEAHRTHISSLASPRAMMSVKLAEQLLKAVNLAPDTEGSKIKPALKTKLDLFITPATASVMELGL